MNSNQKKVAIGAIIGGLLMVVLVTVLYFSLPLPTGVASVLDRIIFAMRWNVVAELPLVLALIVVGQSRFFSEAIDPLRHAEDRKMEINGRVVDNTLQQNFVFLIGTIVLSTNLTAETIKLIPALVLVYVIARIAFWIGYHIDPMYRAPGMAATSYMNVGILLVILYYFVY